MEVVVIDNSKAGDEDFDSKYEGIPQQIISRLASYLKSKSHPKAEALKDLKPTLLRMPWRTQNNHLDCGVFLMRHMETYRGDTVWKTDIPTVETEQKIVLNRLRIKYVYQMLFSKINSLAPEIRERAKAFLIADEEKEQEEKRKETQKILARLNPPPMQTRRSKLLKIG